MSLTGEQGVFDFTLTSGPSDVFLITFKLSFSDTRENLTWKVNATLFWLKTASDV